MKALIIGSRARYEKFYPGTEFADSVEKVYVDMGTPEEEILSLAGDADYLAADAIAKVSAKLIENMPKLKVIHSEGVGFNGIDTEAAAARNIYVCNNRGINASAVAEQTILLMLGLLRDVVEGNEVVRQGLQIQTKERKMVEGITELGDCRIGLIGFGDIAKATALCLKPFGCEVFYYAKHRKSPEVEETYDVSWADLEQMATTCDMISIHVPVTPETEGMIDEAFFRKMKPGAYIINTARGEIIDNEALKKALIEGWSGGAGLDTVAPEPVPYGHLLTTLPEEIQKKVLLSPHIGGITTSTFKRAHRNIWKAFEDVGNGRKPANVVNGI